MRRRAIIIGGSMSGLFSAAFLRQIGWDVDVYERSRVELVGRGAGITGHPELFQALEASGAGTKNLGVEVPKRIAIDRSGRVIDERPLRQTMTSWDRMQRLLRATIDDAHYHLGCNFEHVDQDDIVVKHARKLGTHLGVNLTTEEDHRMHELLQNDSAMLDWIAVPGFLAAYGISAR
jgi:2-polyprenyl-6-methoxyphenol hydroxylase-like FAD-dependent oxidoreductase